MPLTVITLKKSPMSLRGDLTKWMQEISTGVYVGNFSAKIRENLWQRVIDSVGDGEATMSYACRNELGYNFKTHNSVKIPLIVEGLPLVFTPHNDSKDNSDEENENKYKPGFSNAAKMRNSRKFSNNIKSSQNGLQCRRKPYVIIDLETTGLNPSKDLIIEIGAIKVAESIDIYTRIVNQTEKFPKLPDLIKQLTGIDEVQMKAGENEAKAIADLVKFIGDSVIIGYNINFDINFINEALKKMGSGSLTNKTYDVMKYVKKDKMFIANYKLETVLKEYDINTHVPHRALEDARIIQILAGKLDALMNKLIVK